MTSEEKAYILLSVLEDKKSQPDEYERLHLAWLMLHEVKKIDSPIVRSKIVMSKTFTDLIEESGYVLEGYEHSTKGTWKTWLAARIATTK